MNSYIYVLLAVDSDEDAGAMLGILQRAPTRVIAQRITSLEGLSHALKLQKWDMMLAMDTLPYFNVFAALAVLCHRGVNIPSIIVSKTITETQASSAVQAGAYAVLTKSTPAQLALVIERVLCEVHARQAKRVIAAPPPHIDPIPAEAAFLPQVAR